MNILWQDSVGSFLDPSIIDAASYSALSPGGDGGALWSSAPDGGSSAAGASLLWDDGAGTSSSWQALLAADGMSSAGWQHDFGVSRGSLDIAWPDTIGAGTGLLWQPNGSQTQEPFAATPLAGSAQWTSSLSTPADILWSGSEPSSLPALLGATQPALNMPLAGNPFSLDSGLLPGVGGATQPLLGTPSGGGSPPIWTSPLSSLPASQLVWDASSSSAVPLFGQGAAPSGGQLPLPNIALDSRVTQLLPGSPAIVFGAHS
jgi:hypothetical protein